MLEKVSGLKFNVDFFCGYSPERINPGDKVNTLTTICKITSGSIPEVAEVAEVADEADEADALYNGIIKAGTWKASSIKVAEAAESSIKSVNALTGFAPFAARGIIVTDELTYHMRDAACV